ncbi:hypothetical protein BT69DRAFT_1330491 [Atractiella rhizophila]|nr:hypothetical protein BT69DRAFT_1330491 [Atractiella rhizophila]
MRSFFQTPTPWHAVLATVIFQFSNTITLSILPALYRKWGCTFYLASHPDDTCEDNLEVEKLSSSFIAALTTLACVTGFLSVSLLSHLVHDGLPLELPPDNLPMRLATVVSTNSTLGFLLIVLGNVLDGMFGAFLFNLAIQNYIVDTVPTEARATYFAIVKGSSFVMIAIASSLGGWIYDSTGKLVMPFVVSTITWATLAIYALALMPESLTAERRAQIKALSPSRSDARDSDSRSHRTGISELSRKAVAKLRALDALENLKSFLPQTQEDGTKDWRIFGAAFGYGCTHLVTGFSTQIISLYATGTLGLSASELGYVLSFLLIIMSIYLLLIFPLINTFVKLASVPSRRLRRRSSKQPPPVHSPVARPPTETTPLLSIAEESSSHPSTPLEEAHQLPPADVNKKPLEANEFDRGIGWLSYLLHMAGLISVGNSKGWEGLVASFALIALSGGAQPAIHAYMTCLVEFPDRLLAGLQMLDAIGLGISPVILTTIYQQTLDTSPEFVFYFSAGIYLFAAIVTAAPPNTVKQKRKQERRHK